MQYYRIFKYDNNKLNNFQSIEKLMKNDLYRHARKMCVKKQKKKKTRVIVLPPLEKKTALPLTIAGSNVPSARSRCGGRAEPARWHPSSQHTTYPAAVVCNGGQAIRLFAETARRHLRSLGRPKRTATLA